MANIASARKRARQSVVRNAHNVSLRSALRTSIKSVRKAIAAGDKSAAAKSLQSCQPFLFSFLICVDLCSSAAKLPTAFSRNRVQKIAAVFPTVFGFVRRLLFSLFWLPEYLR